MYHKLTLALKSSTLRQSVITVGSVVTNGLLGAVFYFLLARKLGPTDFGLFSLAVTTIGLLVSLFDLGSDQGIVKFVSHYREANKYFPYAKLAFDIKVLVGVVFIIIFTFFSKPISEIVFKQSQLSSLLPLVGLGVLTQLIFSFSTSLSQALQKYWVWGGLFVSTNLLRLLLIGVLIFSGSLSGTTATITYILMPLIGFLVSALILDFKFLRAGNEISLLKEFFSFNKWVTGFVMISAVSSRLDVYFTARLLDLSQTGIYALALQISSVLPQLSTAIGAVIAPKFASFKSSQVTRAYVLKASVLATSIAILMSIVLLPVAFGVFTWSGSAYASAWTPLIILLVSMSIFLATTPLRDSIVYYFSRPDVFFWASLIQLVVVAISCSFLIPIWQINGAAISIFISQLVLLFISLFIYFRFSRVDIEPKNNHHLVFISRTSGEIFRGVETFIHEMGNRLSRLGLSVTIIQNGPPITNALYDTISLHLPQSTSLFTFSLYALKRIPKKAAVIIPVNGTWLSLMTRLYSWFHHTRMIITGHAGLGRDDLINLWCFPDIFVAQTQFQADWARRRQPFVKIAIVPNGVDTATFNPEVAPHNFNLPWPVILNVGALEDIKRQELLIKAAAKISASVVLVGRGSRELELLDLGQKYLGNRFKILHFTYPQMPAVYAGADLLAYPSAPWESFGLAILEAMATGKPVVVSADPIRQEIVGPAGLTVDPENIAEFSHTLKLALDRKWGDIPRHRAQNFSWNKVAKQYLQLIYPN